MSAVAKRWAVDAPPVLECREQQLIIAEIRQKKGTKKTKKEVEQ